MIAEFAMIAALAGAGQPHFIACGPEDRQTLHRRPASCVVPSPSQSYGFNVNLRRLRWHGWGDDEAHARGEEAGRPVRVLVWRARRACDAGEFGYTRIRVTSSRGRVTARLSPCPDFVPTPDEIWP